MRPKEGVGDKGTIESDLMDGGPCSRGFHVFCNGEALLKNLDVFKEAGGAGRALEKSFTGVAPNEQGYVLLEFKPVVNYALIYAVEVTPESKK